MVSESILVKLLGLLGYYRARVEISYRIEMRHKVELDLKSTSNNAFHIFFLLLKTTMNAYHQQFFHTLVM